MYGKAAGPSSLSLVCGFGKRYRIIVMSSHHLIISMETLCVMPCSPHLIISCGDGYKSTCTYSLLLSNDDGTDSTNSLGKSHIREWTLFSPGNPRKWSPLMITRPSSLNSTQQDPFLVIPLQNISSCVLKKHRIEGLSGSEEELYCSNWEWTCLKSSLRQK
jgi:hypothetical protein